jgi:dTDP-4-amino-4,6-dideoxygalactose transaminase
LHLQKAYAYLQYRQGDFPVAEKAAAEIVSLPMFPQLAAEQQARVVAEILSFIAKFNRKHAEAELTSLSAADRTA